MLVFLSIGLQAKNKEGVASWYHDSLHGNLTANGEVYDKDKVSCAHKTLPFGTILEVTNIDNDSTIIVRVNDRGPFIDGRDLDMSRRAAEDLGMIDAGVVNIKYKINNRYYINYRPYYRPLNIKYDYFLMELFNIRLYQI